MEGWMGARRARAGPGAIGEGRGRGPTTTTALRILSTLRMWLGFRINKC